MADAARPLLASEGGGERAVEQDGLASGVRAWPRKRLAVVGSLLLAGSGLLLASARGPKASPFFAPTELLSGWGDASCYTFTGGTCMVYDCDTVRGATCGLGHNCYCSHGCTGADGRCRPSVQSYELVASHIRLRNAKYDDQYMYAPRTWFMEQLRTTSGKGQYADLWNIYKLPGQDFAFNRTMYFLSPVEFPEYAAGIAYTKLQDYVPVGSGKNGGSSSGLIVPVGSMFVVDLYHLTSRHGLADRDPFNIAQVMNTLCRPRERPEAIQISGALGQATWYIHHASWEVFGWVWSQPGDSGHWIPEPLLDMSLPFC